ncbi:hypothetical protein ABZP36_033825 [Zizania latifolia]
MEGGEGIAVANGHEVGFGLFRAGVSMTEAQEAAKECQSSLSSPSTSPTPSPPPAAATHGGEAAAMPPGWSLGGEKPSEAAGDNGMQMPGHSEHANLSSGRRRGRPKGSGRRQILATLGEWYALSAGGSFTPHVIIVAAGEDVAERIMSFSQKGPRSVCILSANGTISNVALNQPGSSGSTFTYEGRFEILQLAGSFTMAEEGGRRRTGGLSVSLAGPDGRVVGGVVAGMLRAASPIQNAQLVPGAWPSDANGDICHARLIGLEFLRAYWCRGGCRLCRSHGRRAGVGSRRREQQDMAKGDDALARKRNKVRRKRLRSSENAVSARVAAIIAFGCAGY